MVASELQLWIQIASTILITFTLVVYVFQLRAMRSASNAQNILAVLTFLQQPDVREARRIVYTTLVGKPINLWTDEEKRVALCLRPFSLIIGAQV